MPYCWWRSHRTFLTLFECICSRAVAHWICFGGENEEELFDTGGRRKFSFTLYIQCIRRWTCQNACLWLLGGFYYIVIVAMLLTYWAISICESEKVANIGIHKFHLIHLGEQLQHLQSVYCLFFFVIIFALISDFQWFPLCLHRGIFPKNPLS